MPWPLALIAGLLFGAGLAISGMINPAKVANFLDVAGDWDPTLAFVMAGALATTAAGYALLRRRRAPLFAAEFSRPPRRGIDGRLLAGAAAFGVGWGLAAFVPVRPWRVSGRGESRRPPSRSP